MSNRLFIQWAGVPSTLAWAKGLFEQFPPAAKKCIGCAGDILGYDVAKLFWRAARRDISRTISFQPLIYTHPWPPTMRSRRSCPPPHGVAGHSTLGSTPP